MSSTSSSATIQYLRDVLPDLAHQIELLLTMLQILSVLNFQFEQNGIENVTSAP